MNRRVLIADDEETMREALAAYLREEGFEVVTCGTGTEAAERLRAADFAVLLTDLRMPGLDGMELLRRLPELAPGTIPVVITAYGTIHSAVEAMKIGARDYIVKPFLFEDVLLKISRLIEFHNLSEENVALRKEIEGRYRIDGIIGESPAMRRIFEIVRKVARAKTSVLLEGESGTGKELLARAIHYGGETRKKRFVAVNCGAIPATLVESELFGYRKGAFSGATRDKEGLFEAADGGTLFLDELSCLPPEAQAALLRATEEKAVRRIGDTTTYPVDFRLIGATNRRLSDLVEKGLFREDLLYRLNVVTISIPPLRERLEDIPRLAETFLERFDREMNTRCESFTTAAMQALLAHPWKGNVRELENVIERAVIFAEDRPIDVTDLPFGYEGREGEDPYNLRKALATFEKQHILRALQEFGGDKCDVARRLGIGLSSLYRKLEEYEVPRGRSRG